MANKTTKENFIASVFPYAQKSADILKTKGITVDPLWITAQWAHETGYGQNTGSKYNNLAGMYAYNGSPYGINGKQYESLDDFVVDYSTTLSNKRYSGIDGAGSVTAFASALKAGGYATDPNYAYANTWTEAVEIGKTLQKYNSTVAGESGSEEVKWYDLYRIDPTTGKKVKVSWKDFFLGPTVETKTNEDGSTDWVIRDNTKLDSDPTKDTTLLSAEENWFDLVKLGFFQFLLFILVLFFLYGALIKGSTIDDIAKAGVKTVSKGMV